MLTDKQAEYIRCATRRWNIKTGATGAGKTYLDVLYTIPKRLRERSGTPGLNVILGNTKGTLQRNIIEPMQELYGPALVSCIRSDNTATLFGERCFCLGADNKKHVDRLRGSSVKYAYGDEMTTWNEEVFRMLQSRLRCANSAFDGTCNPAEPQHWVKAFIDGDADIYSQAYTIDDNPTLPADRVAELKREYAGTVYYDRYILGRWTRAEGLVYPMFDPGRHVTAERPKTRKAPDTPEEGEYYISVDYGTANPMAMLLWCVMPKAATCVAEYYYDGRKMRAQKTDEEYYAELVKLAGDHVIQAVIVDPSAASFITAIRRHGKYSVRQANNDVANGIRHTASMINSGRLLIHESCADTIRELGAYSWDEKLAEDKVVKENDHAMDSMRYFVMTVLRWLYQT